MALTLVEASKLANDVVRAGVIDEIVSESHTLSVLPFIPIVGNALTYNRLNEPPSAAFYDVGDTWAEDTPSFTQVTATLRILGGDADVDNFLATTRRNVQDLEAEVLALKAKAVRTLFEDTFVNGDEGSDPNSFDGLDVLCDASQVVSMGANGGTLTLDKLDELIDQVRPGKAHALIMSRRTRRQLKALARSYGLLLESESDQLGRMVTHYDGIPIEVNDYISDAQTVGTSNDCSTIYALQYGVDAVAGLAAEGQGPEVDSIVSVERVGSLESQDATRWRVKAYVSLALFDRNRLAKLVGVRP